MPTSLEINLGNGIYRHILLVVPDGDLARNKSLLGAISTLSDSGSRVSIVCPPQAIYTRKELIDSLPAQVSLYEVPMHLKAAELYELGKLLGRSPVSIFQTWLSRMMDMAVRRDFDSYIRMSPLPGLLRRPLEKLADRLFDKITELRYDAAARNQYWKHYRKLQFPADLYRKYEDILELNDFIYNYFYFIKALIINKSTMPIDAVCCYSNYIWNLPVGCLLKELLGVELIYAWNPSGKYNLLLPEAMRIAKSNEGWMLDLVDRFIDIDKNEIIRSRENALPTYRIDPSPVMYGARIVDTPGKLNIAILYDETWAQVGTIYEYLSSFRQYLPHNVHYIPATVYNSVPTSNVDLSLFDVVILHYSVVLCVPSFIDENLASQLARFEGPKVFFTQDEYESTEITRSWMDRLQPDIVYTCVPQDFHEIVFPRARFPDTLFKNILTGYVPDDSDSTFDACSIPLAERRLLIGYRGRILPYHYGKLGYEKYEIGIEVRKLAESRGLSVDIELEETRRIYGIDWYRFLGSTRAMLGTESGSNVFDFDGKIKESIARAIEENPEHTFESIYRDFVAEHEGAIRMNQISPKIFEAIQLRTALILFEGEYSGVITPDLHFMPLKKDYSNIDEIFEKLHDIEYLERLTSRAYEDIISSGKYSYEKFVKSINAEIELLLSQRRDGRVITNEYRPLASSAISASRASSSSSSSLARAKSWSTDA